GDDSPHGCLSLVDKSLLRREPGGDDAARFRMLQTLRDYALERLSAVEDEEHATRELHADTFVKLVERAEPQLTGPQQVSWFPRIELEHDNLRAALRWSLERGDVERAVRLVRAMW